MRRSALPLRLRYAKRERPIAKLRREAQALRDQDAETMDEQARLIVETFGDASNSVWERKTGR